MMFWRRWVFPSARPAQNVHFSLCACYTVVWLLQVLRNLRKMTRNSFSLKVSVMTNFIKVADLHEVQEGSLFPAEADGELICLTKLDGIVYAFTDDCTHISGPLNEGELEGCTITCPWHGAQFDVC